MAVDNYSHHFRMFLDRLTTKCYSSNGHFPLFVVMSDQNSHESILDRVIHSQQVDTLEHFNPAEIVSQLLKLLSQKEADVLRRRFGLGREPAETLETIGASFQVTRERVRQIQRLAVQHLKTSEEAKRLLRSVDILLQSLFEEHGGLLLENELITALHQHAPSDQQTSSATMFLLEEMLSDKFERVTTNRYKTYWKPTFITVDALDSSVTAAEEALEKIGRPVQGSELLAAWRQTTFGQGAGSQLREEDIFSYMAVAKSIDRNPFGEFGLRTWGSVVPKRMNDKILMVLRRHGKPMHFLQITEKINEIGFDHRQAYPPTVHNELILNKEYVLVGRGVYALREWGYKPGVVADVIVELLKEQGPMDRDAIVSAVMQQRMVKKNTVHLALTNKQRFQKLSDGRYAAAEMNTNTNT
jgi:hypothetical protein